MKRKLVDPPIFENVDCSPLADIEGLDELEPADGCFVSSRMRDKGPISKGGPESTLRGGHVAEANSDPPQGKRDS